MGPWPLLFEKSLRGHVWTILGNMLFKFKVRVS